MFEAMQAGHRDAEHDPLALGRVDDRPARLARGPGRGADHRRGLPTDRPQHLTCSSTSGSQDDTWKGGGRRRYVSEIRQVTGAIENGRPVTHLSYQRRGTASRPAGFFPDADFEPSSALPPPPSPSMIGGRHDRGDRACRRLLLVVGVVLVVARRAARSGPLDRTHARGDSLGLGKADAATARPPGPSTRHHPARQHRDRAAIAAAHRLGGRRGRRTPARPGAAVPAEPAAAARRAAARGARSLGARSWLPRWPRAVRSPTRFACRGAPRPRASPTRWACWSAG